MKKSRFSEEQIATALRQVDAGAPIPEITRPSASAKPRTMCGTRGITGIIARDDTALRRRLRKLAQVQPRFGKAA